MECRERNLAGGRRRRVHRQGTRGHGSGKERRENRSKEEGLTNIFWDSNLFIYLFEEHSKFGEPVRRLRRSMRARGDRLFTSGLTVGEILVKPVSGQNKEVADRYTSLFSRPGITVLPFDLPAALKYASIRQNRAFTRADAMQLATAAAAGINLFVTNDERLIRAIVPGIDFISSVDRAPI